jgi:hypothetical protein
VLEEKAARYMGVTAADRVVLTLDNVDAAVTEHQVQVHPQKPEMGMRVMLRSNKVRRRAICKSFFNMHLLLLNACFGVAC